ncbi:RNA polymerase sigma factor [Desertivirga brevis]|uniref:RNA polymerase sigma factor n=1 Tax=Desertivirga brevis TaxID=2810310 RepID=UPI001F623E15|nr:RNA polymerase sigma factor [Pedobacter sp. SYSU D00873]
MEAVYIDPHFNLVVECKDGNRKAQFELYKLYSKAMYNIAMRILNDADEASDMLQESFIDAFLRIKEFRQESSFGMWIKQIVVNKCISQLRKRKFEFLSTEEVDLSEIPDEDEFNEEELQLQVEEVKKAIHMLPEGYRIVLSLYLLEGYDHEEIAFILKITESTSRTQLLRAKRKLTDLLTKIKAKDI